MVFYKKLCLIIVRYISAWLSTRVSIMPPIARTIKANTTNIIVFIAMHLNCVEKKFSFKMAFEAAPPAVAEHI